MTIRFTKMHGLGNDFIVIDAIHQSLDLQPADIAFLAKRNTGIGFDQCLLIERSQETGVDFFYRIFNANGQEVGQCGNGARCLARFVSYYGLTQKKRITVATRTTKIQMDINSDKTVTVHFAPPKLNPDDIPLKADSLATRYTLPLADQSNCKVHAIQVGNPHAVMIVKSIDQAPVCSLGKEISEHPLFPEQSNVNFMEILNTNHIRLRVYERGCQETQACGSGAVASVAIGRLYHQLGERVRVSLPGGDLFVYWPELDGPIYLSGPATFVYEGKLLAFE